LRSERAGIGAAVDQDVLPRDVAGLRRAQEGAGRAEFIGVSETFGRIGGPDLLGNHAHLTGRILRQRGKI
jgi:hypothetical protein